MSKSVECTQATLASLLWLAVHMVSADLTRGGSEAWPREAELIGQHTSPKTSSTIKICVFAQDLSTMLVIYLVIKARKLRESNRDHPDRSCCALKHASMLANILADTSCTAAGHLPRAARHVYRDDLAFESSNTPRVWICNPGH